MSSNTNHIVVPVDFSDQSRIALTQSYNLARFTQSEITLVHVIDEDLFSSLTHLFSDHEKQAELMIAGATTKLEELANEARAKTGLPITTRVERGKIYARIVAVAEDLDASFIIMGTKGQETLRKKFIGSNAVRVINEAHCPVITIKGKEHRFGCPTIVLPLDLTKETKEKVVKCVEIAQFFKSEVKVVSVEPSEDEYIVNKLNRQMDQVVDFITEHGIKCSGEVVLDKDISHAVLQFATKVKADLIIIMTQQELEWTEFIMGTKSQKVINHSDIPVCSIRPIKRKDTTDFVIS